MKRTVFVLLVLAATITIAIGYMLGPGVDQSGRNPEEQIKRKEPERTGPILKSGEDTGAAPRATPPKLQRTRSSESRLSQCEDRRRKIEDLVVNARQSGHGMNMKRARGVVRKDDVDHLHRMLEDPGHALDWNYICVLIGLIGRDPGSVPFLSRFVEQDHDWRVLGVTPENVYEFYVSKSTAIASIGYIGGADAEPLLQSALSETGAKQLTSKWLARIPDQEERMQVLDLIRVAAAQGLAYSRSVPNQTLVRNLYEELQKEVDSGTRRFVDVLYSGIVDTMALQDVLETMSKEEYLAMSRSSRFELLSEQAGKYLRG